MTTSISHFAFRLPPVLVIENGSRLCASVCARLGEIVSLFAQSRFVIAFIFHIPHTTHTLIVHTEHGAHGPGSNATGQGIKRNDNWNNSRFELRRVRSEARSASFSFPPPSKPQVSPFVS